MTISRGYLSRPLKTTDVVWLHSPSPASRAQFYCFRFTTVARLTSSVLLLSVHHRCPPGGIEGVNPRLGKTWRRCLDLRYSASVAGQNILSCLDRCRESSRVERYNM
uniref:Uncharacterized protein n=1 Tax=Schistocephalus solidus TaxID=70667 RepID=A0A0X3PJ61_SCHSO